MSTLPGTLDAGIVGGPWLSLEGPGAHAGPERLGDVTYFLSHSTVTCKMGVIHLALSPPGLVARSKGRRVLTWGHHVPPDSSGPAGELQGYAKALSRRHVLQRMRGPMWALQSWEPPSCLKGKCGEASLCPLELWCHPQAGTRPIPQEA